MFSINTLWLLIESEDLEAMILFHEGGFDDESAFIKDDSGAIHVV